MKTKNTYTLAAEWHPQSAVMLSWPHSGTDWHYMLDEVNACFIEIAKEIALREKLLIISPEPDKVRNLLSEVCPSKQLIIVDMPNNDTWARDHGALTLLSSEGTKPILLDFTFNGWGLKYAANYDNQITRKLFNQGVFGSKAVYKGHLDFVLEGGSIESNGQGTLLTTSQCLLEANRNAGMTKEQIDLQLKAWLGVDQILWLDHGYLEGDDTDSHIDTLARFCDENTICYVKCSDTNDPHFEALQRMEDQLLSFRNRQGEPFRLIPLPMAEACFDEDGHRLPATYANFLIINGAVLVPVYNSNIDKIALTTLSGIFTGRKIVPVDCSALIKQHGSLHCVTMQFPELVF
ncbi:MAG: agmatine/peptidylarginine deiminase [Cyclobacteriaceae bacterium]